MYLHLHLGQKFPDSSSTWSLQLLLPHSSSSLHQVHGPVISSTRGARSLAYICNRCFYFWEGLYVHPYLAPLWLPVIITFSVKPSPMPKSHSMHSWSLYSGADKHFIPVLFKYVFFALKRQVHLSIYFTRPWTP